jgi:hypothetical protein
LKVFVKVHPHKSEKTIHRMGENYCKSVSAKMSPKDPYVEGLVFSLELVGDGEDFKRGGFVGTS